MMQKDAKLIQSAQNGFSLHLNLVYLKSLKQLVQKVPYLSNFIRKFGFGLKAGVDAKIDLTLEDIDDLRGNLGHKIDMTFDQFLMTLGHNRK